MDLVHSWLENLCHIHYTLCFWLVNHSLFRGVVTVVWGGTKADVPGSIPSRKGLALPFSLVPYPSDVPAGLFESVCTKHRAEIVSVFQWGL